MLLAAGDLAGLRDGEMTDASVALLKGKEYIFPEKDMDLNCAFRLRAPLLGQPRIHVEGPVTLFRFHLEKSFAPRETVEENNFAPFSSLWGCDDLLLTARGRTSS